MIDARALSSPSNYPPGVTESDIDERFGDEDREEGGGPGLEPCDEDRDDDR